MKIMLDAGHGGKDPGACKGGRQEKTDVLNMVLRVGQILSGNGAEVHYTRTTDVFDSPDTKAKKGNNSGAELFASFHRNSATSTEANGYETLVYSNDGKAKVVADAANSVMDGLGFRNRGTKIRKELAVLRGTTMQAVLFEMGFISNDQDNARFDSQFEQIAQGLAGAILAAFGKNVGNTAPAPNPQPAPVPSSKPIDVKYQAYVGRWLPDVLNTNDYAGIQGKVITGIRANTVGSQAEAGNLMYRVHIKGGKWLLWVIDRKDYAGIYGKLIDGVQMKLMNGPAGKNVQYRVSPVNEAFLPWVTSTNDYAGLYGKAIDRLQVQII